jgi:hypothetical protein
MVIAIAVQDATVNVVVMILHHHRHHRVRRNIIDFEINDVGIM